MLVELVLCPLRFCGAPAGSEKQVQSKRKQCLVCFKKKCFPLRNDCGDVTKLRRAVNKPGTCGFQISKIVNAVKQAIYSSLIDL